MQIKEKLTFTITLTNSEAKKVVKFKNERPNLTHRQVYLRGIEGLLIDEGVTEELKQKAKDLVGKGFSLI